MTTPSDNRLHALLKIFLLCTALQVCVLGAPRAASATDVVVIRESDIKPYRAAIDGIKSSCSCSVQEFNLDRADEIEQALRKQHAAVVTVGSKAFRKAGGLRDIPLIYSMVMPSETAGPLPDNVSGASMDIAPGDYLDAITGLFPDARRIGLLYDPKNTGDFVREAESLARSRRITLVAVPAGNARRIPDLLEGMRKDVDVFWMLPDPTVVQPDTVDFLMMFSFRTNLPVFSFSRKYAVQGAAAALMIDPFELGAQAGRIVKSLVEGGRGPVRVYARNAKLIVNRKVCTKIGVRMNDEMVRRAEKADNQ